MTPSHDKSRAEELRALASRIEGLAGPDRGIDVLIALAKGWQGKPRGSWFTPPSLEVVHHRSEMPRYTASLNAAMSLYSAPPAMISSCPRKATADALRQLAEDAG
jgi:hypothetical protein